MSLVDLLCDEEETNQVTQTDYILDEKHIIEVFRKSDYKTKRRLLRYFELVEICKEINQENDANKIKRNVSVIQDIDGNNIVISLKEADPDFLQYMTMAITPKDYTDLDANPVGTGPYKFVSRSPQENVILKIVMSL